MESTKISTMTKHKILETLEKNARLTDLPDS